MPLVLRIQRGEPVTEEWSIDRVAKTYPPVGWKDAFVHAEPELEDVSSIVENQEQRDGCKSYPLRRDMFNAFHRTPLDQVKVVIIGQDPYPNIDGVSGLPQAIGMSFAVRLGVSIPVSLRNIYKEMARSMPETFVSPAHGDLTYWAQQGVLLLNTCLTVPPRNAGGHKDIWLGFVSKILAALAAKRPNAIYLLWGAKAQVLRAKGLIEDKAICLETSHPSGHSAHSGFIGCDHFVTVNKLLADRGETPIDWNLPTPSWL